MFIDIGWLDIFFIDFYVDVMLNVGYIFLRESLKWDNNERNNIYFLGYRGKESFRGYDIVERWGSWEYI